ncbi:MAG: folate-binding protein [Aestuariivirga sp.]
MLISQQESRILPGRGLISLEGETSLAFLQDLLTCDVETLAKGSAAYGGLLSPQGKILYEIFVMNHDGLIWLDCPLGQREGLTQKLKLYRLRAKIIITEHPEFEIAVGNTGWIDPRHADLGRRQIVAKGSLPETADYHAARIAIGLADGSQDLGEGKFFPHEANWDQFPAVSFTKGCYVGQEVVSRMQHRATARSRILPVMFDGEAEANTPIVSGDTAMGETLSATGDTALALLRLDRLAEAKAPLFADGLRLHVKKPDWIKYEVTIPEIAQ